MISDERLDQTIRSSLESYALRAAQRQPTLHQATTRLAARLGSTAPNARVRVMMAPAPGGLARLILTLILLLAMLAAAALVGAYLLDRNGPDPRPGPFGFAALCPSMIAPTAELHVELDGGPITRLHTGGVLVTDLSREGAGRKETVQQALTEERRLSPRGRTLLLERVIDAGLTPGCRSARTERSSGQIIAVTPSGYVEITWGPTFGKFRPARPVSAEGEAGLVALARDLMQPSTWLPPDAWVDEQPVRAAPEQWLVTVELARSDYPPGAQVNLPNGVFLDGFDPRYERVALPGGADLATFGEELPFPPPQPPGGSLEITVRCASISDEEALELAESLDQMVLDADGWGDLFTTDLSMEIAVGLRPAIPAGYDCQDLYEDERSDRELLPAPSPVVAGNVADTDPCSVVPADGPLLDTLGVARQVELVAYLGAAASRSCALFDTRNTMSETASRYGYWRAALTLYPSTVTRTEASQIALGWLGEGAVEDVDGERIVWANACAVQVLDCAGAYVAWSNGYLIALEHATSRGPYGLPADPATARSFVDAALAQLETR